MKFYYPLFLTAFLLTNCSSKETDPIPETPNLEWCIKDEFTNNAFSQCYRRYTQTAYQELTTPTSKEDELTITHEYQELEVHFRKPHDALDKMYQLHDIVMKRNNKTFIYADSLVGTISKTSTGYKGTFAGQCLESTIYGPKTLLVGTLSEGKFWDARL